MHSLNRLRAALLWKECSSSSAFWRRTRSASRSWSLNSKQSSMDMRPSWASRSTSLAMYVSFPSNCMPRSRRSDGAALYRRSPSRIYSICLIAPLSLSSSDWEVWTNTQMFRGKRNYVRVWQLSSANKSNTDGGMTSRLGPRGRLSRTGLKMYGRRP